MNPFWKKFNFLLILFLSFPGFAQELKIVAVINDDIITSYELDQAMVVFEKQLKQIEDSQKRKSTEERGRLNVLEEMIRDRLLEQEMKHLNISASEREIDEEVKNISKRAGLDVNQFENVLKSRGLSMEKYRESISDHLRLLKFIARKIRPKIQIDEDDIRYFYERNTSDFKQPDQVHLVQIILPKKNSKKRLQNIKSALEKGETLPTLQKKYKGVSFSDLGFIKVSDLSNELRLAIADVKEGGFSQTIDKGSKSKFYFVLKKISGKPYSFEEAKESIRGKLFEKEIQQELDLYIRNLRRQAHIEVRI